MNNESGSNQNSLFPYLGMGLGLRSNHFHEVLAQKSKAQWFEVITENYLGEGGRPLHFLEQVRTLHPLALHGVSLNIGSASPLDLNYLKRLKNLAGRLEPALVSDHLCWTGVDGINSHDLLPLPFTQEAVKHIVDRVLRVQDILGRRILLENVSSYICFPHAEMSEAEFLKQIAIQGDCGILLDVNNVYVSSVNHDFNAQDYISELPKARVAQVHLAGHSQHTKSDGQILLIDTHDHPVCPEVWKLYEFAIQLMGPKTTMIEWDAKIPALSVLEDELKKARTIEETLFDTNHVSKELKFKDFAAPISSKHHQRAPQP